MQVPAASPARGLDLQKLAAAACVPSRARRDGKGSEAICRPGKDGAAEQVVLGSVHRDVSIDANDAC